MGSRNAAAGPIWQGTPGQNTLLDRLEVTLKAYRPYIAARLARLEPVLTIRPRSAWGGYADALLNALAKLAPPKHYFGFDRDGGLGFWPVED